MQCTGDVVSAVFQVEIQDCAQSVDDLSQAHPMQAGKRLSVTCPTQCLKPKAPEIKGTSFVLSRMMVGEGGLTEMSLDDATTTGSRVFGSDKYAPESSVCAAAIHSGACPSPSHLPCNVTIDMLAGAKTFKGRITVRAASRQCRFCYYH